MYDKLSRITESFEEKAKNLSCDTFVWILKGKTVDKQPLLTKLDTIVTNMPSTERDKFGKRFTDIIPNNEKTYIQEYNDQFLEACVEVLGWGWLKDRYHPHMPCLTMGTPDLLVKDNSDHLIAAMECKHKRHSKLEAEWLQHPQGRIITGRVDGRQISFDYNENPFLRNLADILC